MPSPDFSERLQDWFDGVASESDRAQLADEIESDPEADRLFDERLRMEALLQAAHRPPARQAKPHRRLFWVAAAAAAVVVALLFFQAAPPRNNVYVSGSETKPVRLSSHASMLLSPDSVAIDQGPSVYLQEGAARFSVAKGKGPFRVETPLGTITVLGTEFLVELLPAPTTGETEMKSTKLITAMAVAVFTGSVEVQMMNHKFILGAGESSVLAKEGENVEQIPHQPSAKPSEAERRPSHSSVSGELSAVEAGSVTVVRRSDAGQKTDTFTMNQDTKIMVETDEKVDANEGKQQNKWIEGSTNDLRPGIRVKVTHSSGVATRIDVPLPPAPKTGGEH